jgi:predicted amidohydrolase YtcJ
MLVDGPVIAWLGEDSAADAHTDAADEVVDLRGALVTPGFVDAHVHATSTGLALTGLDLSGCRSLGEALDAVSARARALRGGVIIGHGWDETDWPEGRPPTRQELDRATWGSVVYLSRIDVHSALVSGALVAQTPGITTAAGYSPDGPVSQEAHHLARIAMLAFIPGRQRREAQAAALARAAELGIVAVHEMAGPTISSEEDAADLRAASGLQVHVYWGELARDGGIERARELGAVGVGGDLFADGAIGSRTACLHDPYADAPDTRGAAYLSVDEVCAHVVAATRAGLQAGFHVIGDAAADAVVEGLRGAAAEVGEGALRAARHRLEHAELLTDDHIAQLSSLGITASMQPMFDALWGGPAGMYQRRLGSGRADTMNRFADMLAAGVPLAFGSDAPVTALGPWAAVRAAVHHSVPAQRISARAAFAAHTRGAWRAVGRDDAGVLAPGSPAHYALWQVPEMAVQAPDERIAAWSTDPRSGTPGLPVLADDIPLPVCLRTVVDGQVVYDSPVFDA